MNAPLPGARISASYYAPLVAQADAIEARYRAQTTASARLAEQARGVFPGGSTRQGVFRRPYPFYVTEASGSHLVDADGRRIVDFWFNAAALPLGHADPDVVAALAAQLPKGTAYFAPTALEIALGQEICGRVPSGERVFFANTGGEAVMMALRVARRFTGRPLVAKFEGSFHGSHDDVLWSVSPAAADCGRADSPTPAPGSGGLLSASGRTIVLPFNDLTATREIVQREAGQLAAIIVEPVSNRMGFVLPRPGFLESLRALCDEHGIVLIFDEVLCFRVSYRGMQGMLGVTPDLTVLGKIIGGGLPVGAVAGKEAILAVLAEGDGRVYHTGTFAANPMTMTAGLATLRMLKPEVIESLNGKGARVRDELRRLCSGLPLQVTGVGSLFKVSATGNELVNYRSTLQTDVTWQETASLALLNEGCLLTTQLHGCVAMSTSDQQIDLLLAAFDHLLHSAR
ncbi:MAG: aspartate aminotransferase family protein [Acidobacteria bacterium]|nr:aspartate aminotransferase family protein [Acidobacteriota bacterium]